MDVAFDTKTHAKQRGSTAPDQRAVAQPDPAVAGGASAGLPLFLRAGTAGGLIQPKLVVGQPDDPYEREADRVAEQVVRPTAAPIAPTIQRRSACGGIARPGGECAGCSQSRLDLQRSAADPAPAMDKMRSAPAAVHSFLQGTVQTKEKPSSAPQVHPETAAAAIAPLTAGDPLPDSQRDYFEPRFSTSFDEVRIYTGPAAEHTAARLHAQAFTFGSGIVFGRGEYQPDSTAGRLLLAHELTHIVQQSATSGSPPDIQRQLDVDAAGMTLPQGGSGIAPGPVPQSVRPDPLAPTIPPIGSYDPCQVQVGALTNAELLLHWQRAYNYVTTTKRGEGSYYDYANLMRRLIPERRTRVRNGHIWLAEENLTAFPGQLYEISSGGEQVALVMFADMRGEAGAPQVRSTSSVMTPDQFVQYLEQMRIPQIDVGEYYGRHAFDAEQEPLSLVLPPPPPANDTGLGFSLLEWPIGAPGGPDTRFAAASALGVGASGMYASPFDLATRGSFLRPVYTPNTVMTNPQSVAGAELYWRGIWPETAVHAGSYADMWRYQDLNRLQANFPVFDTSLRSSPDVLISTTHSLPDPTTGAVGMSHYREKFRIMMGNTEPGKMTQALTALNQSYGTAHNIQTINQNNFLAVPDDHVALVQMDIENVIAGPRAQAGSYSNLLNVLLTNNPITIGGVTYSSWNQVPAARANGTLTTADYATLRQALGQLAAQRVIPAGITTGEILEMLRIRVATQNYGPGAMNVIAPPEVLEVRRLVALGLSEDDAISRVARSSARRGAIMGGGMAAGLGALQAGFSDDPHAWRHAAINVPLSAAAGAGDAWLTAQFNARMMQPLLNRAIAGGSSPVFVTGAGLAGRTVASTGIGAIAAPAVTLGAMGIDELFFGGDYTKIDYAALGARTAVSGGMAAGGGFLATVGVPTLIGSKVPVLGTAAGFLVGVTIYFVADNTVGEDVEDEVRESMGEYGCAGTPNAGSR
jgi:hypothetical protein